MFMIVSPDDIQVYELNTGILKVKTFKSFRKKSPTFTNSLHSQVSTSRKAASGLPQICT
jgi:hypothetical protein